MMQLQVTFGPPLPTQQGGIANLSMKYEKVTQYDITDGLLTINLDGGATVVWNWTAVLNITVDPHGSIVKPTISLT